MINMFDKAIKYFVTEPNGCMGWSGPTGRDGVPILQGNGTTRGVSKIVWEAAGRPAVLGRLARLCGNPKCLELTHMTDSWRQLKAPGCCIGLADVERQWAPLTNVQAELKEEDWLRAPAFMERRNERRRRLNVAHVLFERGLASEVVEARTGLSAADVAKVLRLRGVE